MQDRQTATPGRVLITPENGTAPFNAIITRDDNAEVEGTPLNKATLLSDDAAASFDLLGDTATPDGAFKATNERFLSMGNLHVWEYEDSNGNIEFFVNKNRNAYPEGATDLVGATFTLSASDDLGLATWLYSQGSRVRTKASSAVLVSPEGVVSLDSPNDFDFYLGNASINDIAGKYFVMYEYEEGYAKTELEFNKVYYAPPEAKVTVETSNTYSIYIDKLYEVQGVPESKSGTYTYLGMLGSGAAPSLKRELIGTAAVNKTVSTSSETAVSISVDNNDLNNSVGIVVEFVGTITMKWVSSNVAYGYLIINGTNSEYAPILFATTSTRGSAHTWTWTDAFVRMALKSYTNADTSGLATTPGYVPRFTFVDGSTTKIIGIEGSVHLGIYAQNCSVTTKGTLNVYKIVA